MNTATIRKELISQYPQQEERIRSFSGKELFNAFENPNVMNLDLIQSECESTLSFARLGPSEFFANMFN